jgi:periodic tryptophan protein 1
MARRGGKFTLTSVLWIPRGAAKPIATRWEPPDEEQHEPLHNHTASQENVKSKNFETNDDDSVMNDINQSDDGHDTVIVKTYGLDTYDEKNDRVDELGDLIGGVKDLMYDNPEDDPYITNLEAVDAEDSDDLESLVIRPTDFPLLTTVCEEDGISHLDVYLVDALNLSRHLHSHIDAEDMGAEHLWIHHDYLLSAFPLCMAWFDFPPFFNVSKSDNNAQRGNFVAVGTFEPAIEVWDLDVMDSPPCVVLGGSCDGHTETLTNKSSIRRRPPTGLNTTEQRDIKTKKKKQTTSNTSDLIPDSHTKAVISLSWNKLQPNLLASGSADHSVKVWDLTRASCMLTLRHHEAEVQNVQWHPRDSAVLSSASYDRHLRICDVRQHTAALAIHLEASPEAVAWLLWSPTHFLVSDERGQVFACDMRQPQQFLWRLGASSKPCAGLAVNHVPGLLVTCSTEKESPLKVWDIGSVDSQLGTTPSCLVSKTADVGPAHCVTLCPDPEASFLLAVGGVSEHPHVFDLATLRSVNARWNLSGERKVHNNADPTTTTTTNNNNNNNNNNRDNDMKSSNENRPFPHSPKKFKKKSTTSINKSLQSNKKKKK